MTPLQSPPRVARLQAAKGIGQSSIGKVDPTGGRYGAGLISGVSLCSRGEALGHSTWIDDAMIDQIVENCNANPKLLKCRFAHPDWCDDGTGKAVGTIENASRKGEQAIGDLHLYQSAHNAPDGDLAGYVMSLATEDPANFGLSIVFEHDSEAEALFEVENTREVELKDDQGAVQESYFEFVSPDPLNTQNLPHARIKKLWASDVVDDPAANPNGLFHRQNDLLKDGTALLDFALGKSQQVPALSAFNVAPERVRDFVTRYLAKAGLSLVERDDSMLKKLSEGGQTEDDPKDETNPSDKSKPDDTAPEDPPENNAAETETDTKSKQSSGNGRELLAKFVAKFGAENGANWHIEGISYEAALECYCDSLTATVKEQQERLKALGQEGTEPVKFSHAPSKQTGTTSQSAERLNEVCGEGLGRIAAAIKLPKPSNN